MPATDDDQALRAAYSLHQQGNLTQAADLYRQLIGRNPRNFHALHLLGILEAGAGNIEQAKALMARSLAIKPPNIQYVENYATILCQAQEYEAALQSCQKGLLLNGDSASLLYVSAVSLFKLGRLEEALTHFNQLLAAQPRHIMALNERGSVLAEMKQFGAALESVEMALGLNPRFAEAQLNKGNLCSALGRYDQALAAYDSALALRPDLADAWLGRGNALRAGKRFDEAMIAYDKALASRPGLANAWLGRGNVLYETRRYGEAIAAYDRAIALNPRLAEAWLGRGNSLFPIGRNDEAITAFDRAIEQKPDLAAAWLGRSMSLAQTNRLAEALADIDNALALRPDFAEALSARIVILDFAAEVGFEEARDARRDWWREVGPTIARDPTLQHGNSRDPSRRVKIGYVSADFRKHSAALSFRPVLLNHDRSQFEITCYSSSHGEDEITEDFRRSADCWRDVTQLSDERLCQQIGDDRIDILVDLSGHSAGHRLGVFARKPAPVQVTAWGHATGTGLPSIDYLFSDPIACPQAARPMFAEKIFDLPCFISVDPLPDRVLTAEPPVLSKGYVTFGVFNRASKISDQAVTLWSRILHTVPQSRLLLKSSAFDEASARARMIERFAAHGVATDRLGLLGGTTRLDHLAAFDDVDISLDPFPVNGGISTWESLQVGVPVVAKLGNSLPSRTSGAILTSVGMGDWVSENAEGYLAVAVNFAAAPDRLKALRQALPAKLAASASGNCAKYTKTVEAAYRTMWEEYCRTAPQG